MKRLLLPAFAALALILLQCTPKTGTQTAATPVPPQAPTEWDSLGKPLIDNDEEEPEEYRLLDEISVKPPAAAPLDSMPAYNASHTFEHDLIHTRLELSFDWTKKRVNGKATLTLRPWFYATDRVTLDAKNFDIHRVTFDGKADTLPYMYDNEQLTVMLGRFFTRTEEFKLSIAYTAKPDERSSYGGSDAISSDKGLYFINPDGSEIDKPRQIWTQGETESNSFWFPTVDKPNERCTQEMILTVEDKYKTLSNGVLASTKKNADGTRTDYWKMDKPHAPYLFMLAIGEYAVVKDKWRGIDLEYYVEPKFEPYARDIFPYTAEMLELFSKKLNYDYPWQKYSQVVVRDYVSGAMENTTAVIFGEFMQKTKRELLDEHLTNEKVVAHEMFHHWFGDLVTTESWANLTLNEGFANYSEYLWMEHKYGADAADHHLQDEQQGYIYSAAGGGHPLIHFGYDNREDMFDAHSYNKGGCVLHMLRRYVGDDAFFSALNRYLKKNEYTDVEVHELRMAFEDVTGQDLNWFFNQWYLGAGHPMLDISYDWDEAAKKASVTVEQQQTGKDVSPIFNLPLFVDIYQADGSKFREAIRVNKRKQTFTFNAPQRPALLNFDAEKSLLCVKTDRHTPEEWMFMYRHAPLYRDRAEALEALQADTSPAALALFKEAVGDKFWVLRLRALRQVYQDPEVLDQVARMAESDPEPAARALAINVLGETGDAKYAPVVEKGLAPDAPYSVLGAALSTLRRLDPDAVMPRAKTLENEESDDIIITLAELYSESGDSAHIQFFEKKMAKMDFGAAFAFFEYYQRMLVVINNPTLIDQGIARWQSIALDSKTSQWRRFAAAKAIADVRNFYRDNGDATRADTIQKIFEEIRSKETDAMLLQYYDMF